jgi:P-type E1-E2 ATPase
MTLTAVATRSRPSAPVRAPRGLSESEAARLIAEREPFEPPATSRSYASIVRANVFTVFNLILLVFGVLTLVFGDWRDALFLGVLVSNSAIGIVQEVRAKRALDRLAALVAPTATVVRDGLDRRVHADELVVGDLVRLAPGDQVVADGLVETAAVLRIDESILTGESRPIARASGDEIKSGSFVVEGTGSYRVRAVGPESYAARIAGEARAFRHPRSPLERALNRLLLTLLVVMVPLGVLLGVALQERRTPIDEAVPTSVAAVVSLIPEGLILLASLTYAVAALRMARKGALVQQLNAVESLASVDVVCLDKTGTLTEGGLRLAKLIPASRVLEHGIRSQLGRFAASSPTRNATLEAIATDLPADGAEPDEVVPFSSRWRWSGLTFAGRSLLLGDPNHFRLGELGRVVEQEARRGRRVLAFAEADHGLAGLEPEDGPPEARVLALVVLAERLRPDARSTVSYLLREGVGLKVLSGDDPQTAAAIAEDAGIDAGIPVDGRELPDDPDKLAQVVSEAKVIGRISPEGKRRVVDALSARGRYVAMVGDGVNDVPALKASRLAIAQGGGSQMTKSIADLVLVRGDFSSVPAMVAEGRQILRNLQRVARLFVTKSAFAVFLILSIGLTPTAYPLLPRHLTLAASLTIGIPAFFLALAPSAGAFRSEGFLRNVSNFALPAGTAAGLAVLSSYAFSLHVLDLPVPEARTVATTTLVVIGLYLVIVLEAAGRRRGSVVTSLCLLLGAAYLAVLLFEPARDFFALAAPSPAVLLTAVAGAGLAGIGLWLSDERFAPDVLTARSREPIMTACPRWIACEPSSTQVWPLRPNCRSTPSSRRSSRRPPS